MRAFIAVEIPADVRNKIVEFKNRFEKELGSEADALKFVEDEKIHITLRFFPDIDKKDVNKIKEIINSLDFSPFEIRCRSIGIFPNENFIRVIWIGAESDGKLESLVNVINEKLNKAGLGKDRFTSHITIARVKRRCKIIQKIKESKETDFGSFVLQKDMIVLKKSERTEKGYVYSNL